LKPHPKFGNACWCHWGIQRPCSKVNKHWFANAGCDQFYWKSYIRNLSFCEQFKEVIE